MAEVKRFLVENALEDKNGRKTVVWIRRSFIFRRKKSPNRRDIIRCLSIKDESETQTERSEEKIKKVKRLRKRKERERWSHLLEQVRVQKI